MHSGNKSAVECKRKRKQEKELREEKNVSRYYFPDDFSHRAESVRERMNAYPTAQIKKFYFSFFISPLLEEDSYKKRLFLLFDMKLAY